MSLRNLERDDNVEILEAHIWVRGEMGVVRWRRYRSGF